MTIFSRFSNASRVTAAQSTYTLVLHGHTRRVPRHVCYKSVAIYREIRRFCIINEISCSLPGNIHVLMGRQYKRHWLKGQP